MDERQHRMDLADEEAVNQRYLSLMRRKVEMKIPIGVSRSALWTGSGLPVPTEPTVGPLVGRVGLDAVDDAVGGVNFYIGPWHVNDDNLIVFSWAAPIAASFYGNHTGDGEYDLRSEVVVRRTLSVQEPARIVQDFFDEWLREQDGTSPFAPVKPLSVPVPPKKQAQEVDTVAASAQASQLTAGQPATNPELPRPATITAQAPKGSMRAEGAVRAALAAPRGKALPTLLATLQPDQYDFVTRPTEPVLAVQGHPGTGKTVIAAHRAAYLVHPERNRGKQPPRVLLVGPNQHYAGHVKGVVDALVAHQPNPVAVMGLSEFLQRLRRLPIKLSGPLDGEHYEVSIDLGDFAEAAAYELRLAGELLKAKGQQEATWMVYEAMRANGVAGVPLTDDPDWIKYLRKLPVWNTATTTRRFLPLLAQCSLSAVPIPAFSFDHVIVDEAQDVRPLEWRLLRSVNAEGSWTLLGDMNQRRSDWSYHTWNRLAQDLELVEEGEPFEPDVFKRGYRSTAPIINFANHLLPKEQRGVESIQEDGPEPIVKKAKAKELVGTAIDLALDLQIRHADGTTAIIVVDRKPIGSALHKEGWTLDPQDHRRFVREGVALHLITPEGARGLEFDAVVVVEPDEFPPNLGRMGSLYTSLTRANRELAVVYSTQLPDGLREKKPN